MSIAPSLVDYKRGVGTADISQPNGDANSHSAAVAANGDIPNGTNKERSTDDGNEQTQSITEPGNPSVVPAHLLRQFHFAFLIRHPRSSIPSYYRCTVPPLNEITGFKDFMPSEAGYAELRRFFDFLRDNHHIGPSIAGNTPVTNGDHNEATNGVNGGGNPDSSTISNGTATGNRVEISTLR